MRARSIIVEGSRERPFRGGEYRARRLLLRPTRERPTLALPLDHIPSSKGVAFLVEWGTDDFTQRMDGIRRAYPDGQELLITERSGSPVFKSYLVENPVLVATSPGAPRD